MAQPPKKSQPAASAAPARHRSPRREREQRRQRQIIILSGIAIGVAVLALIGGVLYDQIYIPGQTIARANGTTLTRGGYWSERRSDSAANISQALFLTSFGPQFAQQVLGQISALDTGIQTVKTESTDGALVDAWIDRQLISQGAQQLGIQASDGEVAQLIDSAFGPAFGPVADMVNAPTVTAIVAPTETLVPTTAPTEAPTVTPGGPTLTPAPTLTLAPTVTPAPTEIPSPTPPGDQAITRADTVYKNLYSRYLDQLAQIDPSRKPLLTEQDFKLGLFAQFQRQVFTTKIAEQLIPDAAFTPTTDPSAIETRHILLKVTTPVTATEQELEAAFAARRPEIDAILAQLRGGADFETLAKEKTEDFNTKESGGALPSFDKDGKATNGTQIDLAIVQAAAGLQDGQISEVVRTPFGWHVVQLIQRTVDTREQQIQAARTKAFDEWLTTQRAAATIERDQTPIPTLIPTPTGTAAPLPTAVLGGDPSPTPLPEPTPLPGAPTPTATPTP
jgi:parvulin-like peptidyl-prolyl isomerase